MKLLSTIYRLAKDVHEIKELLNVCLRHLEMATVLLDIAGKRSSDEDEVVPKQRCDLGVIRRDLKLYMEAMKLQDITRDHIATWLLKHHSEVLGKWKSTGQCISAVIKRCKFLQRVEGKRDIYRRV